MKYLLIVWMWAGYSPTMTTGDFISLESCERAANTIKLEFKHYVKSSSIKTVCVEK